MDSTLHSLAEKESVVRVSLPALSDLAEGVSVSAGVCPAVSHTMCLSLATTPMPTGGAPGSGRLQLLPGVCAAAGGAL